MSKPARRKDMDRLAGTLEHVADAMAANRNVLERLQDTLADHGIVLTRLERDLGAHPALAPPHLERISTLLDGVKAALERTGGNTLPSFRNDILALRDQMSEFRREMADYRATLMALSNWLDTVSTPPPKPERPKRTYNRRKKVSEADQPQVEISALDAAPHNDQSEVESGA